MLKDHNDKYTWQQRLADELHKPIKRKFKTRKVIVKGIDDIWSADLVEMQKFSKWNKGYRYLLNIIDVFSKFAWSIPIKNKTGNTITESFDDVIKKIKTET